MESNKGKKAYGWIRPVDNCPHEACKRIDCPLIIRINTRMYEYTQCITLETYQLLIGDLPNETN